MRTARSHFASAICQGRIYIFGGGGEGFKSLNSVEIYDPVKSLWTEGREMPTTRSGVVAVTLNNRIYVMGGGFKQPDGSFRFLTTVEIYDPAKDDWEKGPDLLMRHDAPSATVLKGHVYLIGGHHPEAKGGPLTDPAFSYAEQFIPRSGRWTEIPPMPTPRFSLVVLPWEGRLIALGGGAFTGNGFTNYDRVEAYTPAKKSWSEQPHLTLPWPAAGPGACVLNGRLHLFGGNNGEAIQRRAACYDPMEGKWIELSPMPEARVVMAALPIHDNIYIIGGRDATGKVPVDSMFVLSLG
jgi:N-acetylneuraminic acid mutarotase